VVKHSLGGSTTTRYSLNLDPDVIIFKILNSDKGRIVQGCNNKVGKNIEFYVFVVFGKKEHFAYFYSSKMEKNLLLL